MYRSFGIFGLSAALFVAAASCSRMQSFELSGRIDGLQVGDTLRFERVLLPEWNYEPAFDVVVGEAGAFAYRGEQAHDGYYSMTYHPKSGRAADADRRGKSMIVTGGDRITLTGTAEAIYYCTLGAVSTTIPRFPNCCTSRIRSVGFGAVTAKMRVQLSHAATKRRAGGGTTSSIGFMPTIRAPHANAH